MTTIFGLLPHGGQDTIARQHMRLYKYVTLDILHKILEGRIRFTPPGQFNDPFEIPGIMAAEVRTAGLGGLVEQTQQIMSGLMSSPFSVPAAAYTLPIDYVRRASNDSDQQKGRCDQTRSRTRYSFVHNAAGVYKTYLYRGESRISRSRRGSVPNIDHPRSEPHRMLKGKSRSCSFRLPVHWRRIAI